MMTDVNTSELKDNAFKWAKAFCDVMRDNNRTVGAGDEELMLGWFANAIEVAHDHRVRNRDKPRVKPLEWKGQLSDDAQWIETPIGEYRVFVTGSGYMTILEMRPVTGERFEDIGAAKAAAQADYERRILEALE